MSEALPDENTPEKKPDAAPPLVGPPPKAKIHRVCIGCNNMFEVTMDNYEAKHCPNCHKG